jgi:hypothetical protein
MRPVLALVLAMMGAAVMAGQASAVDPSAQADALLRQSKAASGGAAWDRLGGWHERGVIERAGGETSYEIWLDVRRPGMVSQITAAGRWQTRGFDGKTTWVIDASDGASADAGAKAVSEARRNDYFGHYGFYFPDRFAAKREYLGAQAINNITYDVVRVTPDGGAAMDLWIDRGTHRLTALDDPTQTPATITTLTDFRQVSGVLLPFAVTQKAVGSPAVSRRRIASYDFDPVDPKRFASPTP